MQSVTIALMLSLSLASCAPQSFNHLVAPDVVEYSKDKQLAAALEVEGGSCPVLTDFMLDYKVMRDQARAISQ